MDALPFVLFSDLAETIRKGAHAARDLRNEIDAKREAAQPSNEKENDHVR